MKRKSFILVAILAVALWVVPAMALVVDGTTTQSFDTTTGTLSNVFSEPGKTDTNLVSATAVFSLVNAGSVGTGEAGPYVKIVLTNTTPNGLGTGTPNSSDVLAAVFWTSNTFFSGAGSATGQIVDPTGPAPTLGNVSNFWGYGHTTGLPFGFGTTTAGNQGVSAVGLGFGLLPGATAITPVATPGSNADNIDGIDYSVVATGTLFNDQGNHPGHIPVGDGPFVEPSVEVHLFLPAGTLSYSFLDPEAWWGTASGNAVPIPPSVLLMGSGLLGLGLVGWRRKSSLGK